MIMKKFNISLMLVNLKNIISNKLEKTEKHISWNPKIYKSTEVSEIDT